MQKDTRTIGELVADEVAQFGGSWKFIIIFTLVGLAWILLNSYDFVNFDKYPYILFNLVLSFIAAFQAPFIMMSQNRAEKKQDQAYRLLFQELKELLEKTIESEKEIEDLSKQIMSEQVIAREQYNKLLAILQEANNLQQLHKSNLSEIIDYYRQADIHNEEKADGD